MNRYQSSISVWLQTLGCFAAAMLGWSEAVPLIAVANAAEVGTPIYPGEEQCRYELPPHYDWTAQEIWAWEERICLGEVANLSQFEGGDGFPCDPEKTDDWPTTRDIRTEFLETILNHEPYRGALTRTGVRLRCARFNEAVNLSNTVIARPLSLHDSWFRRQVNLADLWSSSLISLRRSVFDGLFYARGLEVTELLMDDGASFKEVDLIGAKVGGFLWAKGSTFYGLFSAERLEVTDLFMDEGASFKDVRLFGAKVSDSLWTAGSTFNGLFDGDSLEVTDVYMNDGASFKEVSLVGAKVRGLLTVSGSNFDGVFNADGLEVTDLFMRDKASFKDVDLNGAVIRGHLQLRDSDFDGHLNLSTVRIHQELQFTSPRDHADRKPGDENFPPPRWTKASRLTLRNAHVGALNDTEGAWGIEAGQLDIVGFIYDRLGGLRATKDSTMSAREIEWLLKWLAKQDGFEESYSPQPFKQLAMVLRDSGYPGKADAILIAARDHQRDSPATPWLTKARLWVLWGLIGYGYHNWIALLWFAGLTGLGTLVCRMSAFGRHMRTGQRIWYSVDMALPIIELNKRHRVVKFSGGVLVYFYFHKLFGFVLVSFLIAGLSGLTK